MPSASYIKYETPWAEKPCPRCGDSATAHGWLFREPPPALDLSDTRKPFGEVFIHDKSDDCVVLASSEK